MEQQTRCALREELQQFASTLLRHELAEACNQLRHSLLKEFQDMQIHPKCGEAQESRTHVMQESDVSSSVEPLSPASLLPVRIIQPHQESINSSDQPSGSSSSASFGNRNSSSLRLNQDASKKFNISVSDDSTFSEFCKRFSTNVMSPQKMSVLRTMSSSKDLDKTAKMEIENMQEKWESERPDAGWIESFRAFANWPTVARVFINFCILLNGIFIGVQTDRQAQLLSDKIGMVYTITEVIFCVIFTSELLINWYVYRCQFYFKSGGCEMWNFFDTLLVVMQFADLFSGASESKVNLSSLRIIRILRLFRVLRLLRLLRFVPELAVIVSSILYSARSLCWVVLLLLIMMYVVGIIFCQIVFVHRMDLDEDSEELKMWWGSLGMSVMSLYQSILGGIDWDVIIRPLMTEISPAIALIFCLYIAFALLAVMNIITGTFVQSSFRDANQERTREFMEQVRLALSVESNGIASPEAFIDTVSDPKFSQMLKNMNIQPEQAMVLFRILEKESPVDLVDSERLVEGLVRMGDGAKFMDIVKLMYEHHRFQEWATSIEKGFDFLGKCFDHLDRRLDRIKKEACTQRREQVWKKHDVKIRKKLIVHL